MTIYVDDAKNPLGRMLMSHMGADSLVELHAMAKTLGLRGEWFQDHPRHPHYDICQAKKRLALSMGAVEVTSREFIALGRK